MRTALGTQRPFISLGRTLAAKGKYDEAVKAYEPALNLGQNEASLFRDLGMALYPVVQNDQAIANLRKSLTLGHENPETYYYLGSAQAAKREYTEAITIIATRRRSLSATTSLPSPTPCRRFVRAGPVWRGSCPVQRGDPNRAEFGRNALATCTGIAKAEPRGRSLTGALRG